MIFTDYQTSRAIGKNTKFKTTQSLSSNLTVILNISSTCCLLSFMVAILFSFVQVTSGDLKPDKLVTPDLRKLSKLPLQQTVEYISDALSSDLTSNTHSNIINSESNQLVSWSSQFDRNLPVLKHVKQYKGSVVQDYFYAPENERRQKRDVVFQESLTRTRRKSKDHLNEGTFVIKTLDRPSTQYYEDKKAIDINCQQIGNKSFVVSIEQVNNDASLIFYSLNDQTLEQTELFRTPAPGAVSANVFSIKDDVYVLTAVHHDPQPGAAETINTGSTLYKASLSEKRFVKTQKIYLPYATSSAQWTGIGEETKEMLLALAPEKQVVSQGRESYAVKVAMYRWQGAYFDYVSDLPANNPQSVHHFTMFSHDYLAIANYQDDTGTTSVFSEIFKYQHRESKFVSFQRIQTHGAKDIHHFTFTNVDERRQEHFIAIANNCKRDEDGRPNYFIQSTIMKMGTTRFNPFKNILAYGALQFLAVTSENKFFLTMADFHGLRVFQFNGWSFVETASKKMTETLHASPFSISLRQFQGSENSKSYFTVASLEKHVPNGMFEVNFDTRNDHKTLVSSVKIWCNTATERFQDRSLPTIEDTLKSAPKVDDSVVEVNGNLKFLQGLQVGELTTQSLFLGQGRSLDRNKLDEIARTGRNFEQLRSNVFLLMDRIKNDAVWANHENSQEINSLVHFANGVTYKNADIQIVDLSVAKNINSEPVKPRVDNLIFLHRDTNLRQVHADKVTTIDLFDVTSINGRPVSSYAVRDATSSGKLQTFTGTNEFLNGFKVSRAVTVTKSFAGLSFNHPAFLLHTGNQTFPDTSMKLSDCFVNALYANVINGVNFFSTMNDALLLSGGTVTAPKTFKNGGVQMKSVELKNINNVGVTDLYQKSIYVSGHLVQNFVHPVHFTNARFGNIQTPQNEINGGINVKENLMRVSGKTYQLKTLTLNQPSNFDELFVKQQLNNINVIGETSRLDVLLKEFPEVQHIQSKTLKSVNLTQNTDAPDLVDDINLASWTPDQHILLHENQINGILTVSGNVLAQQAVTANEKFVQNDQNVAHLLQNIARRDAETIPGTGTLQFQRLQVKGNSDMRGKMNDVFPHQWVINSDKSTLLEILSEKTFAEIVLLKTDVNANSLFEHTQDGKQSENVLAVLPTVLMNGVAQTINAPVNFLGPFRAEKADCKDATLNNVPFDTILWKTGNQVVKEPTFFRGSLTAVKDVKVFGNITSGSLNGMDIKEKLQDTLMKDSKSVQKLSGQWSFNQLNVVKSAQVEGSVADSDVVQLFGNIVKKNDREVKLTGVNLIFEKGAIMNRTEYIGTVNGIPSTHWGEAWLLKTRDQEVITEVHFAGSMNVDQIQAPTVNNVDITALAEDIIRTDENFNGADELTMNFNNGVNAPSGVMMTDGATVNGINFAKDILKKETADGAPQEVTGSKEFLNGMTVKGNLRVNEINGFDINNFAQLVMPEDNELKRSSLQINDNLELQTEPQVTSAVNGKSWEDLHKTYWMRDKEVVLSAPAKFQTVILEQGGEVTDINNINLNNLKENYASKTRPQDWTGQVIFANVADINQINAESMTMTNDGKLNDVKLEEFFDSVLKHTGDQDLDVESLHADQITANRIISDNGKEVKINDIGATNFMTTSGPNIVTGSKTLKEVNAKHLLLFETTTIDSVNLGEWNDGAARRTGGKTRRIQGPLRIKGLNNRGNIKVGGRVDNVKVDLDNVVTKDKDQVLPNPVSVGKPNGAGVLKAPSGIVFKGTVNGFNIQDAMSKLVFTNAEGTNNADPLVIKGKTIFNGPVTLNSMNINGQIQGKNMSTMLAKLERANTIDQTESFVASERYAELLKTSQRMVAVSERCAKFLDSYVFTQKIGVEATYLKALKHTDSPVIAIGFKRPNAITTENWWSYNSDLDYYQRMVGNRMLMDGAVKDVAVMSQPGNGEHAIFAFAVNSDPTNQKPAQAILDVASGVDKSTFELNKTPEKLSKTFILKSMDVGTPNMRPVVSQIIYSDGFESVHSFNVVTGKTNGGTDDTLTSCMSTVQTVLNDGESSVKIFCMDPSTENLQMVQEMFLNSPTLTTSVRAPDSSTGEISTLLAILTKTKGPEGLLEIWSHTHEQQTELDPQGNNEQSVIFTKQSCLPVYNAKSLDTMATPDGKTFLAVASGAQSGSDYTGSVFIYRYSVASQQFEKTQTVLVDHPLEIKFQRLAPSDEDVMYVLTQSLTNNIQVYKREGSSGWALRHQFTSENGKHLEVADFTSNGVYRAQLLVTCPTHVNVFAAEFKGLNTIIEEELMESSSIQTESISPGLREFVEFDNV